MDKRKSFVIAAVFAVLILGPLHSQEISRDIFSKSDFRTLQSSTLSHPFDILHYTFDWTIKPAAKSIQGKVGIKSKSLINGLNSVTFHLSNAMFVNSIEQKQSRPVFTHSDNLLTVFLVNAVDIGQEFDIEITYSGEPQAGLNFSTHQNQPIFWSLDEPSLAREWFPCYDHPSDKATAELKITVPQGIVTASNGILMETRTNPGGTVTYTWNEDSPLSTYLIFIAGTNYSTFTDTYISGSTSMPVVFYVYPEDMTNARIDFSVTVPLIDFYSRVFGEYPFLEEKYGMAAIPGGTAMEHQTCTSYPSRAITGDHRYDWLIAHELAHQWWGDLVTLSDWSEIWLNEGFATYSDALWFEHLYGAVGLQTRMERFKEYYFSHAGEEHPIFNPPAGHLFCEIIYEKAAWVLHMLRFVVGDEIFFQTLRKYARDFAYDIVTTSDFLSVCEQVSGRDLDWFFDQWIYQSGYPTYQFGWGYGDGTAWVTINQTQVDFPLFRMPLELEFDLPSGPLRKTVWVDQKSHKFEIPLDVRPSAARLDPDGWILHGQAHFFKKGKQHR